MPANTTETTVRFTLYFSDDTTKYLTFSSVNGDILNTSTMKTTIKNFNNDPSEYSSLIVNKSGAEWYGIPGARIQTIKKRYIF